MKKNLLPTVLGVFLASISVLALATNPTCPTASQIQGFNLTMTLPPTTAGYSVVVSSSFVTTPSYVAVVVKSSKANAISNAQNMVKTITGPCTPKAIDITPKAKQKVYVCAYHPLSCDNVGKILGSDSVVHYITTTNANNAKK